MSYHSQLKALSPIILGKSLPSSMIYSGTVYRACPSAYVYALFVMLSYVLIW